jgi:hypothetical protein
MVLGGERSDSRDGLRELADPCDMPDVTGHAGLVSVCDCDLGVGW